MRLLVVPLSASLLAACGPSLREMSAQSNRFLEAEMAACDRLVSAKEHGQCWLTAMRSHWRRENLPSPDLVEVLGTERIALGEQLDQGKITLAQYDVAIARVKSAVMSNHHGLPPSKWSEPMLWF